MIIKDSDLRVAVVKYYGIDKSIEQNIQCQTEQSKVYEVSLKRNIICKIKHPFRYREQK